jgi:hypothetical protein
VPKTEGGGPVAVIPSGGGLSSPGSGAISGADWLGMAMGGGHSSGGGGGGFGGGGHPGGLRSQFFQDPQGNITNQDERGVWQMSPASRLDDRRQAFAENKFNNVWGALSGLLGKFGNGPPTTIGGNSGQGPAINAGPVYNPQQIQEQVNAAQAKNEATSATKTKTAREALGGRGYGQMAPQMAAMSQAMTAGLMNANADAGRNIRQGAAQMNADQVLKGQTAREGQYAARQSEQIARERPYWQQQNALIAALSGLA